MSDIPAHEITSPFSIDPNGKLFWWNGLPYRAISIARTPFYEDLFNRGIIQSFIDKGLLIRTETTDLKPLDMV